MPRHFFVKCLECGKETIIAGTVQPKYCSKTCDSLAKRKVISARIGEPLDEGIKRLYITEELSYRQIADHFQINFRTVMRSLKRSGVEPRHGGEAVRLQWKNNDTRRANIGRVFGEFQKKRTGKSHPRWRGGKIPRPRLKVYEELIQKIIMRDKFSCTRCGMTAQEHLDKFRRSIEVHHKIPYRLCEDDSPSNLATVCMVCHRKLDEDFIWVL